MKNNFKVGEIIKYVNNKSEAKLYLKINKIIKLQNRKFKKEYQVSYADGWGSVFSLWDLDIDDSFKKLNKKEKDELLVKNI